MPNPILQQPCKAEEGPTTPVHEATNQMHFRLNDLQAIIEELEVKLSSAMRPVCEEGCNKNVPPGLDQRIGSELALTLQNYIMRIEQLTERLHSVAHRLEL